MKRSDIDLQWGNASYHKNHKQYQCLCNPHDIYRMTVSEASDRLNEVYKGTFCEKDGIIYQDSLIMVVLTDKETTNHLYGRVINPLSFNIRCPIGGKFTEDDKGRKLYNMSVILHSVDDSFYMIWFRELPYGTLEYTRELIINHVRESYLINGEDLLTACELLGGIEKEYN